MQALADLQHRQGYSEYSAQGYIWNVNNNV